MTVHVISRTRPCLLLLLLILAAPITAAGAAIGRDEGRAERVRGDDDPILIPRSVASRSTPPIFLPSIQRPPGRSRSRREGLERAVTRWPGSQVVSPVMSYGKLVEGTQRRSPANEDGRRT